MDSIQATSMVISQSSYASEAVQSAGAAPGAQAGAPDAAQSMTSMVSNQVQMMLGALDEGLANNELLKMAITLLILEVLLGKESSQQTAGGALLAAMSNTGSQTSSYMYSETTTLTVEMTSGSYEGGESPTRDTG